jgi:hypothetical protein
MTEKKAYTHCCVREIHSKEELQAVQFREGQVAFEKNYDLRNVLSMSAVAQETYWKLRSTR